MPVKTRRVGSLRQTLGFTLIEMLVVLVLLGIITTLLIEGFTYVIRLRSRVLAHVEEITVRKMEENWVRSLCGGLTPDFKGEKHVFIGQRSYLSGLTLAPLKSNPGVPTPFTLQFRQEDGEIFLDYREWDGEIWEIAHWKGTEAGFAYADKSGQWGKQWPVPKVQKMSQLPEGVVLEVDDMSGKLTWLIPITGRHDPRSRAKDFQL